MIRQGGSATAGRSGSPRTNAATTFLLDLDADEVVSPELAEEIRAPFGTGPPPRPIYELELVTVPPSGRPWHGFWLRAPQKLYDRRVVRVPDHKAWDQFEVPPGVQVGRLSGPLFHHSFRDLAHLVAKLNRASTVRATETRSAARLEVGLRVLFAFPVYFVKHYLQRGSGPGRCLRLRPGQHLGVRPLAARRQDVRGNPAAGPQISRAQRRAGEQRVRLVEAGG